MTHLDHPDDYKNFTRVLMLVSRKKDVGVNGTLKTYISHDVQEFNTCLEALRSQHNDGLRIYSTASSLSPERAVRKFKQAQLDAEYDRDRLNFYNNLQARWVSALMRSEETKRWIIDCDTQEEIIATMKELIRLEIRNVYSYLTKNGRHFVLTPFNRKLLDGNLQKCLHKNPLMLWSY